MVENTAFLPEVNVEPLGDVMLDFLIDRDQEEPFVDFKETLNIPQNVPFAKIGKDSFTFSYCDGSRRMKIVGRRGRPV